MSLDQNVIRTLSWFLDFAEVSIVVVALHVLQDSPDEGTVP